MAGNVILKNILSVLLNEYRFLTFQRIKPDLNLLGNYYLAFGIIAACLAGIGRYWDNPRAELWQYLGLGSVMYIFTLALFLWIIVKPLRPDNWSFKYVLIFVGMTSPPALLYAIPVERLVDLQTSQMLNVWFLAVVALWRVILLFLYLRRSTALDWISTIIAAILPLVIIVTCLSLLNLEHVVFRIMAGLAENERSGNDAAYMVLLLLTYFSVMASPVFLIGYIIMIFRRRRQVVKPRA